MWFYLGLLGGSILFGSLCLWLGLLLLFLMTSFNLQVIPSSQFRNFYDRGDLPCCILHGSVGGKITWKVDLERPGRRGREVTS